MALHLGFLALLAIPAASQTLGQRGLQFRFQDNFWVNLHHFVRAEARRQLHQSPLTLPFSELSQQERAAWSAALASYAGLANLNLIFDKRLIAINSALSLAGDVPTLPAGTTDPDIVSALNAAAPVYRAHRWDQHRGVNDAWIARVSPLVQEHAAAVTKSLANAYQVTWPTQPILVDLSCEGGPNDAYTTDGPPGTAGHTVIVAAKTLDLNSGFEIVFHEASHTVDDRIIESVNAEAARQHAKAPEDLWHAIIFYTTGEIVKRELGREKDPTYKPFAYRANIYAAPGWGKLRDALERDWQPYLDGRVVFKSALHDLVRDTSQ